MVTRTQITHLSSRIEELEERMGLVKRHTYTVWLSFHGESDEQFYERHPGARGHRHKAISLSFGADPSQFTAGRPRRQAGLDDQSRRWSTEAATPHRLQFPARAFSALPPSRVRNCTNVKRGHLIGMKNCPSRVEHCASASDPLELKRTVRGGRRIEARRRRSPRRAASRRSRHPQRNRTNDG